MLFLDTVTRKPGMRVIRRRLIRKPIFYISYWWDVWSIS